MIMRKEVESPVHMVLESSKAMGLQNHTMLINKDGQEIPIDDSCAPIKTKDGYILGVILVFRDITERKEAEKKLHEIQSQLIQSEKMAGIGQLAAGVAHEINNPMGFIMSNLRILKKYHASIFKIFNSFHQVLTDKTSKQSEILIEIQDQFESMKQKENYDFMKKDIELLMEETLDGADRVKNIILNLRDFAHPVQEDISTIDLHDGIEKSLALVKNELKYHCKVEKHFNEIPKISCNRGEIGQVFVNLLINASQATENKQGIITIRTYKQDTTVYLEFSDNGEGISEENLNKIFDPFFTTKDVGREPAWDFI